jgi:hypothetical protein
MGDSSGFKHIPADKITAFATSMAAIAAIASGATAFLQLKATFNSQLYNQQIERIGAMLVVNFIARGAARRGGDAAA